MSEVAFSIGGFDIRWYGILISTGIIVGLLVSNYTQKFRECDGDDLFNVVLISLPISIIGARLYYVIFEFSSYKHNLLEIFNIRAGGLAIHGGVIFAVITAYIYTRKRKISFLSLADAAAPSIIIAQAIGRWGNFFNKEAHGGPVSYQFISHFPKFIIDGMHINGVYYHPTFLYESIWNLSVFVILILIIKNVKTKGIVFFSYIGMYSIGRFLIEGLRTDSLMIGPLRIAQIVSIIGVFIWVLFIVYLWIVKRKD